MRRAIGQRYILGMLVFLSWVGLGLLVSPTDAAETISLKRGNPAAHLFPGDQASEHWDLTARFDSGHVLVTEFIITNIGIGDRNAAAFGSVVTPDGKKHRFRNGRREGNWQISLDRLLIQVGKSRLDLHGPVYQLQVDKKDVKLDIQIQPNGPAAWSDAFSDSRFAIDLLAASATAQGSLWLKGMLAPIDIRGTLALTHSWTEEASTDLILRRVEFFSLQPECPLYAVDLTAPNGKRTQWIVAKAANNTSGWAQQVSFVMDGEAHGSQVDDYPVPGSLRLKAPELEGLIQIQRVLLHDDPFDDLPRIFRWMVSLVLNLRPHRSWALSPFELSCPSLQTAHPDIVPLTHGTGMTAVTFLNPLPSS